MSDVTAIIPHYWDSRRVDLKRIVAALQGGEVRPAQIIIWNNTPAHIQVEGADVIEAGRNWGITARFAAAYLARTHFVFFQDNDLVVEKETLGNLMLWNPGENEDVAIEMQGRMLGNWSAPYTTSEYVDGYTLNECRTVDIGLSRMSLMTRHTAMTLARVIPPEAVDDDIWTSQNCRIVIVPVREGYGYQNIPETEGLCRDVDAHVRRRDALVLSLWAPPARGAGGSV
jgi:hypothetical protein